MKHIFIINGNGGVGKDTFVNMVSESIRTLNISSVDIIKQAANVLGWNGEKDELSRKFLSDLKILSTNYNNMPFFYIDSRVKEFMYSQLYENYVAMFIHIREPEEIKNVSDYLKNKYDDIEVKTILIKRNKVKRITSNMADANVENFDYDCIVENNGTIDDLKDISSIFVNDIVNGNISKNTVYSV